MPLVLITLKSSQAEPSTILLTNTDKYKIRLDLTSFTHGNTSNPKWPDFNAALQAPHHYKVKD